MLILSQTNNMQGYHGTVGTPTNMYDYKGKQLFVGDVVHLVTYGVDDKVSYDYGIKFVCEENVDISRWTGKNLQYVMGIANTYNNEAFKILDDIEVHTEEWWKKFETIDPDFRVFKVKDYSDLTVGEKISFLSVVDTDECCLEKGRVEENYKIQVGDTLYEHSKFSNKTVELKVLNIYLESNPCGGYQTIVECLSSNGSWTRKFVSTEISTLYKSKKKEADKSLRESEQR